MAIPHARPAELVDVRPLGAARTSAQTTTLIKTDSLEVIRLVVPAGKEIGQHAVPGEITVQCLEGRVAFRAGEAERELTGGTLMYLAGSKPHSLRGIEDASLLLTILLK
jgi:quercetin dioxygenase-like cupin family protein